MLRHLWSKPTSVVATLMVVLASTFLGACGAAGGEASAPATRRAMLALDVSRSGSSVAITRVRSVSVPEAFDPIDSLGGNLMLVSFASGQPLQAVPVHVPDHVYVEGRGERGANGQVVDAGELPATFLLSASAEIEHIDLLDESGTVLSSLTQDELEGAAQPSVPAVTPMGASSDAEPTANLEREFPHIRFLNADAGAELPAIYSLPGSSVDDLVSIDAAAADALGVALKRVPEAALGAIRSVGVANFEPKSGVLGISFGSSLLVSSSLITDEKELAETVVHEATHNFQFLIDGDLSTTLWNPDVWPPDIREAAGKAVAKHRLAAGVTRAWKDLHESGVELELVDAYTGDDWSDLSVDLAAYGGFASPYGSSGAGEDMAEYVARLTIPENGGEIPVCGRLRTTPNEFPVDLAVPYGKIRFLQALGLLDASQVEACAGTPRIKGPAGIHLGPDVSFTQEMKAGWLNQDGGRFLAVLGDALPYRFMLRVLAPDEQALGMHRLDDIGLGNLNDANNAVYLAHDDDNLLARVSARGLVLLTEVSPSKVEGAIFMLSLQNAAGGVTDSFALSTFSVASP